MTYRFKLNERIGEGVSRIGLEQLEIAATRLASREDIPAAIHDARRCLKRLRALLRLIRPALAETTYRREADRLTGIGRLLSGARDLFVMRQTLGRLESRFGPLPEGAGERLDGLLARGLAGDRGPVAGARRKALERLARARAFFEGKAARRVGLEHLAAGLEATYRRGRKAFHQAYLADTDEAFHAWRKRVQVHWRHMALLSRGWPEALSARAGEARELSRLLGEDHDYAVLRAAAVERAAGVLSEPQIALLAERCQTCQLELRAQARPRGERLFAESPDDLRARVATYWTSACALAELAPAPAPAEGERAAADPARRRRR